MSLLNTVLSLGIASIGTVGNRPPPYALASQNDEGIGRRRPQRFAAIPCDQLRLMVVEDNPLNQMLMRLILEKYGFTHVTLLTTGSQALAHMQEQPDAFDMVLMDCYMPEMNGYDATRKIRALEMQRIESGMAEVGCHVPIIAITANAMQGDEEKCLAAGMDDYIAKPIQEKEFVDVLSQWVVFGSVKTVKSQESA